MTEAERVSNNGRRLLNVLIYGILLGMNQAWYGFDSVNFGTVIAVSLLVSNASHLQRKFD
jgi:hypothetical protein